MTNFDLSKSFFLVGNFFRMGIRHLQYTESSFSASSIDVFVIKSVLAMDQPQVYSALILFRQGLCEALSHSWFNIWSYWWKGGGPKLLISGDSRSWLSFGCIGLFPTFSWRNAIYSKNWHLGNFDATTPDFMSSLRFSRHFFKVPFKFFSCFFKMSTKTNKIHFHTKQLTERWWYP